MLCRTTKIWRQLIRTWDGERSHLREKPSNTVLSFLWGPAWAAAPKYSWVCHLWKGREAQINSPGLTPSLPREGGEQHRELLQRSLQELLSKRSQIHSTCSHPQSPPQPVGHAGLPLVPAPAQCQHQTWVSSAPAACFMAISDCVVS